MHQFADHRVVEAGDQTAGRGHDTQQFPEGVDYRVEVSVDIGVVELDTGDHRDLGAIMEKLRPFVEKGGVVFVALYHEFLARAVAEVAGKTLEQAADKKTRVAAGAIKDGGQQRGGSGLAVGAGHHQRGFALQEEVGQSLGKGEKGQARRGQGLGLGVDAGDDVTHHHQVGRGDQVLGPVARHDRNAQPGQEGTHGRVNLLIRTGYLEATLFQHAGQGGHAGAADAHDMDMAGFGRRLVEGGVKEAGCR